MSLVDPNYDVDWYRVPLSKEQLVAFNHRSNVWGFMQAGGHLSLIIATGAACVWASMNLAWYWLIPLLYLHGTVCSFMINAVHELVHGTVFASKWLNNFFAGVFAFIGWINHKAFWASHSEHHKYTLHDPHDREVVLPVTYHLKDFFKSSLPRPMGNQMVTRIHL